MIAPKALFARRKMGGLYETLSCSAYSLDQRANMRFSAPESLIFCIEQFVNKVLEIIEVNKQALIYDYFNGVTYYLNNNSIYKTTNRAELMEIKNKYDSGEYGLFSECIFLKEHNELPYVMFKNGLMGYVDEENNYEYYFTCAKKNLN